MTDELVKYHNDLNAVIMRGWTSEEMNFFFTILSKAKEKGTKKLTFHSNELKVLSSSARKFRWEDTVISATKKIAQLTYFEQKESSFRVMTLFEIFEVDLEKQTVDVQVSSNFDYILNNLQAEFTIYELAEFTRIKSTYAKTMYRLLKQWRTVGKRDFGIEEFKTLLDTPKSYKTSEIDRAVVKPITEQLSPFFKDLKVKKVKAKTKGTPVKAYVFTWTPEEKWAKRRDAEIINGDLAGAIEAKQIKEAEKKQAILSQKQNEVIVNVEVSDLDAFFDKIEGISLDNRNTITKISEAFEPSEVLKMLTFAESLRAKKEESALAYTIKVIGEWADNDVKTLDSAIKFHEVNYSQKAEQQAKTPQKGGKKQAPASNVPKWSNPDYVNELDPKIVDMLVGFHKSQGTLETPEAQAEIAQKREEIEKGRADLEAQKQELLARLDKKRIDK